MPKFGEPLKIYKSIFFNKLKKISKILNEKVHKQMCYIFMNSTDKTKAEDFKLEYSITSLLGVVGKLS